VGEREKGGLGVGRVRGREKEGGRGGARDGEREGGEGESGRRKEKGK
jgi:hypothetical protein